MGDIRIFVLHMDQFKMQRGSTRWAHTLLQLNIFVSLQGSHSPGSYTDSCVCQTVHWTESCFGITTYCHIFPLNPNQSSTASSPPQLTPKQRKFKILWNEVYYHWNLLKNQFNTSVSYSLCSFFSAPAFISILHNNCLLNSLKKNSFL